MTRQTFDTTEFQFAHGKQPRGTGMWAFFVDGKPEPVFTPCMAFAEAKRWVAQQNPEARTFTVGA
jgi:hypothetical protein